MQIEAEGTLVEIIVSETSMDFGEVTIGTSNSLDITLTNDGTGTMLISDMYTDDEQFYATFSEFTLQPGQSGDVSISYAPSLAGSSTTTLYIGKLMTP